MSNWHIGGGRILKRDGDGLDRAIRPSGMAAAQDTIKDAIEKTAKFDREFAKAGDRAVPEFNKYVMELRSCRGAAAQQSDGSLLKFAENADGYDPKKDAIAGTALFMKKKQPDGTSQYVQCIPANADDGDRDTDAMLASLFEFTQTAKEVGGATKAAEVLRTRHTQRKNARKLASKLDDTFKSETEIERIDEIRDHLSAWAKRAPDEWEFISSDNHREQEKLRKDAAKLMNKAAQWPMGKTPDPSDGIEIVSDNRDKENPLQIPFPDGPPTSLARALNRKLRDQETATGIEASTFYIDMVTGFQMKEQQKDAGLFRAARESRSRKEGVRFFVDGDENDALHAVLNPGADKDADELAVSDALSRLFAGGSIVNRDTDFDQEDADTAALERYLFGGAADDSDVAFDDDSQLFF